MSKRKKLRRRRRNKPTKKSSIISYLRHGYEEWDHSDLAEEVTGLQGHDEDSEDYEYELEGNVDIGHGDLAEDAANLAYYGLSTNEMNALYKEALAASY